MSNLYEIKFIGDDEQLSTVVVAAESMSDAVVTFDNLMAWEPISCTEIKEYHNTVLISV